MMKLLLLLAIAAAGAASYFGWENKASFDRVSADLKALKEKVESAKKKNTDLNKEVETVTTDASAASKAALESGERLRSKTEAVTSRAAALDQKKAEIGNTAAKIRAIEELLNTGGGQGGYPDPDALNTELQNLTAENETLKAAVDKLKAEAGGQRQRVSDLNKVREGQLRDQAKFNASMDVKSREGVVRSYDPNYDFVIIRAEGGNSGLAAGDRGIIERGGQALGLVRIDKVEAGGIVANVVRETVEGAGFEQGDRVVFQKKAN